jgi:MoaA/NifB/PqqE/SkfB family radical SAM enzyme
VGVKLENAVSLLECTGDNNVVRHLPILVIHAHSSCNCRCIMCDIWKNKDGQIFSVSDLESQLGSIRRLGVRWIVFSGGEPLMNTELPKLCGILKEQGIRLTLLSTGLLLKKYAAMVAECFDEVIVSLDGPPAVHDAIRRVDGAFALLQAGVHALREVQPNILITARTTVQKANHARLWETARTAKALSLDGVSFLAVDVTSMAFNRTLVWPDSRQTEMCLTMSELAVLENEIANLIGNAAGKFGTGFVAESPEKLRRIERHFRVQLGLEKPESPLCNAPWVSAVIEADGSVRPCFFHPPMGNIRGATLEAIVNGTTACNFRRNLDIPKNATCRNCVCSLHYRSGAEGVRHGKGSSPE